MAPSRVDSRILLYCAKFIESYKTACIAAERRPVTGNLESHHGIHGMDSIWQLLVWVQRAGTACSMHIVTLFCTVPNYGDGRTLTGNQQVRPASGSLPEFGAPPRRALDHTKNGFCIE
jgi:hypothetical protein